MLKDTLIRAPRVIGRQQLLRRGSHGATELSLSRVRVPAGEAEEYSAPGEETIVVLHEGSGSFSVGSQHWRVKRHDVFTERATALYVPPGAALRIDAASRLEAVI